jgi:glycosyltransferase involved in cell wall biosynthesis
VISKTIEHRVRERSAEVHPRLLVHRLPAIVDARRFLATARDSRVPAEPQFVYCGTWLKDVRFLIRAFASVKRAGHACKLRMVGGWAEQNGQEIVEYAVSQGLSAGDLDLMGCVDDRTLEASYKAATALLMPLWDDDRSRTRLPNKMGEYLATGRPIVTSKVGDLTDFLVDNVNAYLADPGNERDFTEKMKAILLDPRRADRIGAAGQQACLAHLDYRAHTGGLAKFFVDCMDSGLSA